MAVSSERAWDKQQAQHGALQYEALAQSILRDMWQNTDLWIASFFKSIDALADRQSDP